MFNIGVPEINDILYFFHSCFLFTILKEYISFVGRYSLKSFIIKKNINYQCFSCVEKNLLSTIRYISVVPCVILLLNYTISFQWTTKIQT